MNSSVKLYSEENIEFSFASRFKRALVRGSLNVPSATQIKRSLKIIGYDLTSSARDGTKASVLTYHRIIEAFKFAYARRGQLGDPRFNKNKNISQVSERYLFLTLLPVAPSAGEKMESYCSL